MNGSTDKVPLILRDGVRTVVWRRRRRCNRFVTQQITHSDDCVTKRPCDGIRPTHQQPLPQCGVNLRLEAALQLP